MDRCHTGLRDAGAKLFASICSGKQVVGNLWQNVFKGRRRFPLEYPTPDILNCGFVKFVHFELRQVQ